MPFTPYHFGPAGLIGLPFYKRFDLPLFILANVAVDVEVLVDMIFFPGLPVHKFFHTLIGASLAGVILAFAAFPFRRFFKWFMGIFKLNYQPTLGKMIAGGVLGAIFHVVLDAFCWYDVGIFWPWQRYNSTYRILGPDADEKVKFISLICFGLAAVLYGIIVWKNKEKHIVKRRKK